MILSFANPPRLWFLLAAGCVVLVGGSVAATTWLNLHPCHLCVFQRLLFLGLAGVGLAAGLLGDRPAGRVAGVLFAVLAAAGVAVAGYQSWLQAHPVGVIGCGVGKPGVIDTVVDQLGEWLPALFLATGLCEDQELVVLNLSLANWAAIAFAGCLALAVLAVLRWTPRAASEACR